MSKLIYLFFLFSAIHINAQNNSYCDDPNLFIKEQFLETPQTTKNIIYGKAKDFSGKTINLTLDILLPKAQNDSAKLPKRPLFVWIHGGYFITGAKEDIGLLAIKTAQVGYVCANINYRIGLSNLNSTDLCKNKWDEFFKAGYRAVQDTRNAINFLKANADKYNIDTTKIIVAGVSAGAITALQTPFADDSDFLATQNLINPLGKMPKASTISAAISLSGIVIDDCMIDDFDQKTPIFIAHGTCDNVLPFDEQPLLFCPNFPKVSGALGVAQRAECLNIPYRFLALEGVTHDITKPSTLPLLLIDSIKAYLKYEILCQKPQKQSNFVSLLKNVCPLPSAIAPKPCGSTNTINCNTVANTETNSTTNQILVYPNPAKNEIQIATPDNEFLENIQLFDYQGRNVLFAQYNENNNSKMLNISNLKAGLYLIIVNKKYRNTVIIQ